MASTRKTFELVSDSGDALKAVGEHIRAHAAGQNGYKFHHESGFLDIATRKRRQGRFVLFVDLSYTVPGERVDSGSLRKYLVEDAIRRLRLEDTVAVYRVDR